MDLVCRCDLRSGRVWLVGVASIGTSWVTIPSVAIGAATGVVSWVTAGAAWHLAAGGTTGLAVGGFLCLSLAGMYVVLSSLNLDASRHTVFSITDSPGMDCGSDYLCNDVDVRFEWGVSFSFLVPFQENRLSCFEVVFFGFVSSVMVRLQFLFVFAVSFPDFFVPVGPLCWVVVKSGTDCSIHEEFIGCSSCGWVRCLPVCL